MAGAERRTRRRIQQQRLNEGWSWLGPASLEEYCVGHWLQQKGIKYVYLMPFGGYRLPFKVDFQILFTAPKLCFEVQGDKWHGGREQIAKDRHRRLYIEAQGATVIELWAHDILEYPGFVVPTDASFDELMSQAMRGVQKSRPVQ